MRKKHKLETSTSANKGCRRVVADTITTALGAVEREELVDAASVLLCERNVVARKAGTDADAKVVDGAALGARAVGRAHEGVCRETAEPWLPRPHVAHCTAVDSSLLITLCNCQYHEDTYKHGKNRHTMTTPFHHLLFALFPLHSL